MSYFLSALSGLLLMLCFPPFDLGLMAWIALVPLFIAIDKQKSKQGFVLSFFCGLVFYSVSAFWVSVFNPLALPLGIIYLSLFFGLFGFVMCKAGAGLPRPYYLAMIWTSIEYLKTLGFLGFPWFSLGYTQHKFLGLIQISQYTGVWGVTFLIILFNAGLSQALLKKRLDKILILTIIIISCIYLWGNSVTKKYLQNNSKDELNVAVVQGNFDVYTYFKADDVLSRVGPLSMQAVNPVRKNTSNLQDDLPANGEKKSDAFSNGVKQNKIDLVVWTETVLLEDILQNETVKKRLLQLVKDMDCHLLLGIPSFKTVGNERKHFNSAVLISPDGGMSYYNKNHLVPFGELVPGNKKYGFMGKFAELVQSGEYDPDSESKVLEMGEGKFGTMICFEGIFGDYAGKFVNKGANFLVNITEDDWMRKYPSGMKQHAYMSVFRAVENKVYYVRAANSGLSFILDPVGRIIDTMPVKTQGFFVGKIYLKNDAKTFYTKYGDVFVRGVLLFSVIMLFSKVIKTKS